MRHGAAHCGHSVEAQRPCVMPQGGRPLDPQDVGVGISSGQPGCRRRECERPTCRLPASVQDVWSQVLPNDSLRCERSFCDGDRRLVSYEVVADNRRNSYRG